MPAGGDTTHPEPIVPPVREPDPRPEPGVPPEPEPGPPPGEPPLPKPGDPVPGPGALVDPPSPGGLVDPRFLNPGPVDTPPGAKQI